MIKTQSFEFVCNNSAEHEQDYTKFRTDSEIYLIIETVIRQRVNQKKHLINVEI